MIYIDSICLKMNTKSTIGNHSKHLARVNRTVLGLKSEIILSVLGYCINLNFSMVNQWTILGNKI